MKKKLFTIALALCMVFTMIPGGVFQIETAWAANGDTPASVKVGGVEMVGNNVTYYKNDGTEGSADDYNAMYDPSKNTLTLNNFFYQGNQNGIYADGDLNIVLQGNNQMKAEGTNRDDGKNGYGVWTEGDLLIRGESQGKDLAKLLVWTVNENAIFAFEDDGLPYNESITIANADVSAISDADVGIVASKNVAIEDSMVESVGKSYGIQGGHFSGYADGSITIRKSIVSAKTTGTEKSAFNIAPAISGVYEWATTETNRTYTQSTSKEFDNAGNPKFVDIVCWHSHCVCGKTHNKVGTHENEVELAFKKWTDAIDLPHVSGNYYLTRDVYISSPWEPADGTVLCLNGYSITCTAGTDENAISTISVGSGVDFTLTDCSKDENGNNKGEITHYNDLIGRGVDNYGVFSLYGGNISNNNNRSNSFSGGGVQNHIGATFTMYGGSITGNKDVNGAGVYNSVTESTNKRTVFTMYGGTISGNQASYMGGGVYNQGDFIMEGGTISNNQAIKENEEASTSGGGVYNASKGTFNFNGGAIIGNEADNKGGGVYNAYNATFTMTAGTITKNKVVAASSSKGDGGGGVYNFGTFTISNTAEISGNKVTDRDCYGGGVFNYGTFTMNGGTIGGSNTDDANSAGFGGGLHHGAGQAQLNGGMIQGNTATSNGGGVFYSKNITLSGVTITGNTANGTGGGAWMGVFDDIVMTVGGATTITGNTDKYGNANNVHLRAGKSLTADSSLSDSARIGIATLTDNEATLVQGSTNTNVFSIDMSGYKLINDGKGGLKLAVDDGSTPTQTGHKHYLCGKTHTEVGDHTLDVQTEFTPWTRTDSLPDTAGNYYLTDDVTLTTTVKYPGKIGDDYCSWDVPDGVVLCLNGKNITMKNPDGMKDDVDVIKVSAQFALTDCKTGDAQGKITHATDSSNSKYEGKGVKVLGGTFNMYGGIITGNTSNYDTGGSGVCVVSDETKTSEFKLYGGTITGNTAKNGGGVEVSKYIDEQPAVFYMYGGNIIGNTATVAGDWKSYGNGGGVYVSHMAEFVMSGGAISGNTAKQFGGGVFASAFAKYYKYAVTV